MSARQHRGITPLLDIAPITDAVSRAVRYAPKQKPKRKPTKAERVFAQVTRATPKDRKAFHKLTSETQYYGGRYMIRRIGNQYEIFDAESSAVFGPYLTHGDARLAVEGL